MSTDENNTVKTSQLVNELSSYIYGMLILLGLTCVMLLIHIGLSIFFHN